MTNTENTPDLLEDLRELYDLAREERHTYALIIADDMAVYGSVAEWYLARYRTFVTRFDAVKECYFATARLGDDHV